MRLRLNRYWVFQFGGWGLFALINIFFSIVFKQYDEVAFQRIVFYTEAGIIISHLMRETVQITGIMLKPIKQQIVSFVLFTLIFGFVTACVVSPFESIYNLRFTNTGERVPYFSLLLSNYILLLPLFLFWNAFYFIYHFIVKMRKQELDTIKLDALVRKLELETIKAHINPHFIFNSLNSIRALVDEDPARARTAITQMSNILRNSLTKENAETVPFEKELKIVKDYLALESMRFEDRLKVDFDVDERTLRQMLPPMMLQTLVENAIKHGISRRVEGGTIRIISHITDGQHELIIQNTGQLNNNRSSTGFGLSSTRDRLSLMYGDKAKFMITQREPNLVEARVLMPLRQNESRPSQAIPVISETK